MNQRKIEEILSKIFQPTILEVINESDQHKHHQGTPHTENTHFSILIVSEAFSNQSLIERHRSINNALKEGFNNTLHALKIRAKTPHEWHH